MSFAEDFAYQPGSVNDPASNVVATVGPCVGATGPCSPNNLSIDYYTPLDTTSRIFGFPTNTVAVVVLLGIAAFVLLKD